jgi:hypothetical protein
VGAVTFEPDDEEERDENDASTQSEATAENPCCEPNGDVFPWLDARFLGLLRSDGRNLVRRDSSSESLGHRHLPRIDR